MKVLALIAGVLAVVVATAGFLVAASGVIPIKASSGHWALTEWFLQFSKRRSVSTHTLGMELGELKDPALILRGAGAYETACRPCHGSPELESPRIPQAMLPPPPYLPEHIPDWEPEELFYIVKHGIKFTGMPAWPTQQRDDEVRAMVAFLLAFPELDAPGYRRLVFGDAAALEPNAPLGELEGLPPPPEAAGTICARCHGITGHGRGNSAFPKLAGQRAEYLLKALKAYALDERHSGIMQPVAAALDEREMRELAEYYSRQRPGLGVPPRDPEAVERGREIAMRGIPEQQVPACAECHGPQPTKRNPAYPLLAGQYEDYLLLQLQLLQDEQRGGSSYVHIMQKIVPRLGDEQLRYVAAYYASLAP